MKNLYCKYTSRLLQMLIATSLLSSCIADDLSSGPATKEEAVMLSVSLPDPVVKTNTRAVRADERLSAFNDVTDINIVVADREGDDATVVASFYFDPSDAESIKAAFNDDRVTYSVYDTTTRGFWVHFAQTFLTDQDWGSANCAYYIVANYGSQIRPKADVNTVSDLRALKQYAEAKGMLTHCVMFAHAVKGKDHTDADGAKGDHFAAELKRTAAMVTVKVDGSLLDYGVILEPLEVSLHRVPTSCYIGKDNMIPAGNNNQPTTSSDIDEGDVLLSSDLGWPIVASKATADDPKYTAEGYQTSAGGHYFTVDENDAPSAPQFDLADVHPMFLFENIHSPNFGEDLSFAGQKDKRPSGVSADKDQIDANTGTCSYLLVKMQYTQYDKNGGLVKGGVVSYRLFLGNNEFSDFNVEGNKYYGITLFMSGGAASELNVTWRVKGTLSTIPVIDPERDINGSAEFIEIPFKSIDVKQTVFDQITVYPQGTDCFVWAGKVQNGGWDELIPAASGNANINAIQYGSDYYTLLLYVQPMVPGVTWDERQGNVRSISFVISGRGGSSASSGVITITQFAPIIKNISGDEVNDLFGKNDIKLYIDRIDRNARPWGFEETPIIRNVGDGFHNSYHLYHGENGLNCTEHIAKAKTYLPLGTYTLGAGDRRLGEGSTVMEAYMLYPFQWNTPVNKVNSQTYPPKTEAAINALPNPTTNLEFYWSVPSRKQWQYLERLEISEKAAGRELFDSQYPLHPLYPYWTSDAVTNEEETREGAIYPSTDGKDNAFVYRVGRGLETYDWTGNDPWVNYYKPRTEKIRSRFIYVSPQDYTVK